MTSVSVIVPVRDGARLLGEVLAAAAAQGPDELLVIDSGSSDGSVEIARAAGAEVVAIPPTAFAHGPTRNLAAERARGDLLCFITQDATPCPGWLESYRGAFAADPGLGAAFGPHRPRPATSPMIARELEDFFAGFDPEGAEPAFLSNVNACYRRACWAAVRFRDVGYAEDQAFARDMEQHGWRRAYVPGAAVLHAHDYGWAGFMRRYFDEYRGLRETTGHVEPLRLGRDVGRLVAGDRRWLRARGARGAELTRWTARSAAHHAGRRLASAAGSRAEGLPDALQRGLSLERRGASGGRGAGAGLPPVRRVAAQPGADAFAAIDRVVRDGPAPLLGPLSGQDEDRPLHVAVVIPAFRRGSGGHGTIFKIVRRLELMGHTCSVWLHDPYAEHRDDRPAVLRAKIREWFAPIDGPAFVGFDAWYGADVVMATGWQTAHPVLTLPNARTRVYLVNDHEPDFYPESFERRAAADTYRRGMHCIAASPWLRDLLAGRYGAHATSFELGVDDVYVPRPVRRRRDTVIAYARAATPRRAVPLAVMALQELRARRPGTRIVFFGNDTPLRGPLDHERLGLVTPEQLSWAYSEATVGLSLSLTNFSLVPKEMLACGLPCVELAGVSAESIFGADGGPLALAPAHPAAIASALERLLDDDGHWHEVSAASQAAVAGHTWDRAAGQVEAGIRAAVRARTAGASALSPGVAP